MLDPREREIDGHTFVVTPLALKEARATFVRIVHLLGPAMKDVGAALGKNQSVLDLDHTVAVAAISRLMTDMQEDDLEHCCKVFGAKTKMLVGGVLVPYQDTVFAGSLTTMFKWLMFCLEVNYSDFLSVGKDIAAQLSRSAKAPSPSISPKE